MTAAGSSVFSDIILAALNTSTVIDDKCVMLRAVYTDDTRRDMTVTVERYELTEGVDGALAVSTVEQMQLFPSPVAPVITVIPAQPDVPPMAAGAEVSAEPDPPVTWMPAVPVVETTVSTS